MKKKVFIVVFSVMLLFTGCGTKKDLSKYKGVWHNNKSSVPDYELIINSTDEDKVVFDFLIYRLGEFNNIEAKMDDDEGEFSATNDLGWTIKGDIELDDGEISLDITSSSNELVSKGKINFQKGDKTILRGTSSNFDVTGYVGVWRNDDSSSPVDEFIINSVEGNIISFDYLIDGITTFEGVTATLDNNKASFDVVNELEWNIKGYFIMENDEVTLTITDSSNEYIEKTTTTYKLHRDKSNLK